MHPWMAPVLSLAVMSVSLYLIVRKPDDRKARDWAFAAIGLILGYWLK